MINITFDKASEYLWLRTVMECGVLNCRDSMRELINEYEIPATQDVTYSRSSKYINDLKERRKTMIWEPEISFEGFQKKIDEWYKDRVFELCDPPIDAQFALDLIFKTLIDDKENYPYLTTLPETAEQTNSIMLDIILTKYSRKYRKFKKMRKEKRND